MTGNDILAEYVHKLVNGIGRSYEALVQEVKKCDSGK